MTKKQKIMMIAEALAKSENEEMNFQESKIIGKEPNFVYWYIERATKIYEAFDVKGYEINIQVKG